MSPLKIFVGWDSREDIAYQVCKSSIELHASVPVEIIPLKQKVLRKEEIYTRPVDALASTEFTFTRFLIPHLTDFDGWALFIDCDFVALEDVKLLFEQADDRYAVMCAQHDYTPKETVKMDGQVQHIYPRKNWSSMMLINCGHPSNKQVTLDLVNNEYKTGAYFHRFSWLDDSEVGQLSHEWNWLVGWYKEPEDGSPKFLHYTEGGPWFEEYKNCEYASEWYNARSRMHEEIIESQKKKISDLRFRDRKINDLDYPQYLIDYFNATVQDIIDPDRVVYNPDAILKKVKDNGMGRKVQAIAPDTNDFDLQRKGVEYDPYLEAFITGCGGKLGEWDIRKGTTNPLVCRGIGGTSRKAIAYCKENNIDFYTVDTGYIQEGIKKDHHRITKNAMQNLGPCIERDHDRLRLLKWRYRNHRPGSKILIVPPSEKVMVFNGYNLDTWMQETIAEIKKYTSKDIEVRLKPSRNERTSTNTIQQAMEDAYCVVTYNSIAATEALLYGVPAIALAQNSATMFCNTEISQINDLYIPNPADMTAFAAHLSYCQFTSKEMRTGVAWKILNESS